MKRLFLILFLMCSSNVFSSDVAHPDTNPSGITISGVPIEMINVALDSSTGHQK